MTKIIVQTDDKKVAEFVETHPIPKECSVLRLDCSGIACAASVCPMYRLEHTVTVEYIEPPRWRAEHGGEYYFVNANSNVVRMKDVFDADEKRYEIGNYYQTAEEAEAAADRVRVAYRGDT